MQETIIVALMSAILVASVIMLVVGSRSRRKLEGEQRETLVSIAISSALIVVLESIGASPFDAFGDVTGRWLRLACYLVAYLTVGRDVVADAVSGIRHGHVLDEGFLMTVATIGALVLAVATNGSYVEAIAVMLLYKVGEFFEDYAVDRSRDSVTELMDIRPDYACVEVDGKLTHVSPEDVSVGDEIVVAPGERVPLDGIVVDGRSSLDTSALTGESVPRSVKVDDQIASGYVNLSGALRIRTTKEFGESTASRILRLVEDAASRKSKSERFISRFARTYTPVVCVLSVALAVVPPVASMLIGIDPSWMTWAYRALTFIVASCPCALVISIPLSFFAGIGGASREGVLIKGSSYVEMLANVDTVAFDKTGTLTKGTFGVIGIHHGKVCDQELLDIAALAESTSTHPIAASIREHAGGDVDLGRVSDIREIGGKGVSAVVDGHDVAVGNEAMMAEVGVTPIPCHETGTIVHMAIDGEYAGHIVIADVVKESSEAAVSELHRCGVNKVVMLTGDSERVASSIAKSVGVDDVRAELLPADKVSVVEELIDTSSGKSTVAFVGDGINDAPVLTRADVGIAMGGIGSDAAIEAADVVIMDDDPMRVSKAIRVARRCIGIVRQNIVLAIAIKMLCLVLVAVGCADMWFAVFSDVGVMVIAVLNAMRAMSTKRC